MLDFLNHSAEVVAPMLLGWRLHRRLGEHTLEGVIVETEAYSQQDAASHSYKGQTPRTEIMFGPAGKAYVYFTYGMHYCFNIVTGKAGEGSAVLIRALQPLKGLSVIRQNRLGSVSLTNGPAKLCQAFQIDKHLSGHDLCTGPLLLLPPKQKINATDIIATTRVGITKDTERLWRFYIKDNVFVSKPGV